MEKLTTGIFIGLLVCSYLGCSSSDNATNSAVDAGADDLTILIKKDKGKSTTKKDSQNVQIPDQGETIVPDSAPDPGCNSEECDDSLDCTEDRCGEVGCDHTILEGFCLIDGKCFNQNDTNPSSSCQKCDPTQKQDGWSPNNGGVKCDDKNSCTKDDVCQDDGSCQGTDYKAECDALTNDCVEGVCDGKGKCNLKVKTGSGKQCVTSDGKCIPVTDPPTAFPNLKCWVCTEKSVPKGELQTGTCLINNKCYSKGDKNPANACQGCNPSVNSSGWSTMNFTCCKDDTTRQYCGGDGTVKIGNCAGGDLFCRFNEAVKEYGCLAEDKPLEDPTKTYPRDCK